MLKNLITRFNFVGIFRKNLLSGPTLNLDKSHFLWLITYFLKFSSQLEVEMDQIG